MIPYDLAEQLYKSGFPFKRINAGDPCDRHGHFDFNPEGDPDKGGLHFYVPTLPELIDACGDNFGCLVQIKSKNIWIAYQNFNTDWFNKISEPKEWAEGSTHEEAVANLWLALNKK